MQITIPEALLTRLSQLARRHQQSVERVLSDRLFTTLDEELDNLPTAEQAELRALHYLSNDTLRFIAAEQMMPENQDLMSQLRERSSKGTLSPEEGKTLAALVEKGDRLALRKAETSVILASRGQVVRPNDLTTPCDRM